MKLEIQFTSERAKAAYTNPNEPNYGTPYSTGFDLRAMTSEEVMLRPGEQEMIPTGLKINLMSIDPHEDPFRIAAIALPRSGRGSKEGLVLGNTVGLIDQDYLGEIMLCCWARPILRGGCVTIKPNERIAQLAIVPVLRPEIVFVDSFGITTERGAGGFGSTGK